MNRNIQCEYNTVTCVTSIFIIKRDYSKVYISSRIDVDMRDGIRVLYLYARVDTGNKPRTFARFTAKILARFYHLNPSSHPYRLRHWTSTSDLVQISRCPDSLLMTVLCLISRYTHESIQFT